MSTNAAGLMPILSVAFLFKAGCMLHRSRKLQSANERPVDSETVSGVTSKKPDVREEF